MSALSLGYYPFCGFGPIQSGLSVCRGCHATIDYVGRKWLWYGPIAAFLGGLVTVPACPIPPLWVLAWIFVSTRIYRRLVRSTERKNIARGAGVFYRRDP
jgi:hypothetical protein